MVQKRLGFDHLRLPPASLTTCRSSGCPAPVGRRERVAQRCYRPRERRLLRCRQASRRASTGSSAVPSGSPQEMHNTLRMQEPPRPGLRKGGSNDAQRQMRRWWNTNVRNPSPCLATFTLPPTGVDGTKRT
jgi:hypothetical protein